MVGETNLAKLVNSLSPKLNKGEYIFTTVKNTESITRSDILCEFKEQEGITIILSRQKPDDLNLPYDFIASWITLNVHSSLQAVGLTAAFSTELASQGISCNVISGYYHDNIFVNKKDESKAIESLKNLSVV